MRFAISAFLAVLLIHAAVAKASHVYIPMDRRVEESDLIVIGRVIQESPNRYPSPGQGCGRSEAVLTVIEVIRGKLEAPRAMPVGNSHIQTIRVRHYETLSPGDGNFHTLVVDPAYKDRIDGTWFLRNSGVPGVYCLHTFAERLDQLPIMRSSLRHVFREPSSPELR